MMLTICPEEGFSEVTVRDWASYAPNLARIPLAERYLGGILKSWIENPRIVNPLAIPWVRSLITGGVPNLERFLSDFRREIGEDNLMALVPDLLPLNEPLLQTLRRPAALYGEISTYRELHGLGATSIKKLTENGDWLADGHTVSVKTILDLDSNYQLIESAFEGLAWRSEYPMIRRIKEIKLRNGEGLDDRFMMQILDFLHLDLETLLLQLVEMVPYPRWYYAQMELMRDPVSAGTNEKRRLSVKASRFGADEIHIQLAGIGGTSSSTGKRQLELKLIFRNDESKELWMSNNYDTWSETGRSNFQKLEAQISDRIDALSRIHARNTARSFIGWINVTIHPSQQSEIAYNPAPMREILAQLACDLAYPVVLSLSGGFELAKPLLLSSQPPADLFK